jgi:excisionase family DNA binding protein
MEGISVSQKILESVEYAAKRLNISTQRAYQLARESLIPTVRLGRQIKVDPDELEAFIKNGGQALPGGWKKEPTN